MRSYVAASPSRPNPPFDALYRPPRSRNIRLNRSTGSVPRASAMAINSGTLTWR